VVVNGVVYVGSDDNNVYAFGSIVVTQLSSPLPSSSLSPSASSSSTPSFLTTSYDYILVVVVVAIILSLTIRLIVKRKRNSPLRGQSQVCPWISELGSS
jgi:hypothetical protein